MNINLIKLLKDCTIPQIHEDSLREQLKNFGELEYRTFTTRGDIHFNLNNTNDDIDLDAVKKIIINHDYLSGYKQDRIEQLNKNIKNRILKMYSIETQSSANLGVYGDDFKKQVQNDIMAILSTGNSIKSVIMSKKKVETIDAVDINIK